MNGPMANGKSWWIDSRILFQGETPTRKLNCLRMCGQYKKALVGNIEFLVGEASCQRRLSSFELDAFVVVEVYVAVNHLVSLRESSWFVAVNALCFED